MMIVIHNRLQRALAIRRRIFMGINIGIIIVLSAILTFSLPSRGMAAESLAECLFPNNLNTKEAWTLYVGGEDSYLNDCMFARYDPTFSQSGFFKRDQIGTTDDYNYLTYGNLGAADASLDIYLYNGSSWVLQCSGSDCTNAPYRETRSVYEEVSASTGSVMASSLDIVAGGVGTVAYFGNAGTYTYLDIIIEGGDNPYMPTVTLTNTATAKEGQNMTFTLTWDHMTFSPWNVYFYEDAEYGEDAYKTVTNNTNIEAWLNYPETEYETGTGSIQFTHRFQVAGTYAPYVVIGSATCTAPLVGSCSASGSDYSSLVVSEPEPFSETYSVELAFARYNDVFVGMPVYYDYTVDPDLCGGSGVSGRRIFKGYPTGSPQQLADTGAILPTDLGTGDFLSWNVTPQPYSDFVFPYIHVYCNDDSYSKIYAGGAIDLNGTLQGSPRGISVYEGDESRYTLPLEWLAGGRSDNFTESGSYLFRAEKHNYVVGERVITQYQFFPTSEFGTVAEVRLHPDEGSLSYYYTSDSSDLPITPEIPHDFAFEYNAEGDYQPSVKIISASGSTVQFWLGGTEVRREGDWLTVRDIIFSSVFTGSGYGLFGLDPSVFRVSFGNNPNEALQLIESSLNYVLQAVLYLASITFDGLRRAPLYSTVFDTIHPPAGQTYILPSYLFGIELPTEIPVNRSFTITYADPETYALVYNILLAIVVLSFMSFAMKKFL